MTDEELQKKIWKFCDSQAILIDGNISQWKLEQRLFMFIKKLLVEHCKKTFK